MFWITLGEFMFGYILGFAAAKGMNWLQERAAELRRRRNYHRITGGKDNERKG